MAFVSEGGTPVSILGATGSIGRSTLRILEESERFFQVEVLTADKNVKSLAKLARQAKAKHAVVADENAYADLKATLAGVSTTIAAGKQAINEAAARPVDWSMAAIVGAAGLRPTMEAIANSKRVALANKEALVCAGSLVMEAAKAHNCELVPVDSEHSAVFQTLEQRNFSKIDHITLTASGGPFRSVPANDLGAVTPEEAINHPNWSMGAKISVDSATMVNKGLEVIEAKHLFGLDADQIEVVIHPESIIHGMVTYKDGATLAQLGQPDMATPIAYALGYPDRVPISHKPLSLAELGSLTFEAVDNVKFPALNLAYNTLKKNDSSSVVFNAANEVAVESFLVGRLQFNAIVPIIEATLSAVATKQVSSLDDVDAIDREARVAALGCVERKEAVAS